MTLYDLALCSNAAGMLQGFYKNSPQSLPYETPSRAFEGREITLKKYFNNVFFVFIVFSISKSCVEECLR